ncbi:DUF3499 domain-containing protein [Mobiluncus curtisii]|uniref:DUF3499 domain-containing protein n=1 Tax=Mobiluncus curtisii TaxID=2051 RepID=A0A7Y0UFU2_9ACTO|nr:DUF3499 domain-containing protein [Mobiluncus curtisii]MCU9986772.1 DUF3499 domain-containing protein [Mobiluncus curtisii]MCU9999673.1 DUF3499 domain-containing protein [Mobiluncus curtisii]MCV0019991.1 DUF3499 domain-containing protein [Mobiluncus curtisii]NMW46784.1 DUF3499 domain-containing protein [Mobiluncus curtisii]NMW49348.1 DUF3499 domain-containing protein [Mobiluncus curtisii]
MTYTRRCSKPSCPNPAVATMTFDYRERSAIIGPLSAHRNPGAYDFCREHAEKLTAPRGWEVVHLTNSFTPPPPNDEELMALANAVKAAAQNPAPRQAVHPEGYRGPLGRDAHSSNESDATASGPPPATGKRHGHLTLVPPPKQVS